jgi:hypothetical protein
MRDGDDSPATHQAIQCLANSFLRLAIERPGRLIEQKNWRILEKRGIREDSQPGAAGFELTHLN